MTPTRATRDRLEALAQHQAGYVTSRQALEAGYSHQAQWYHRDRGHWVPVRRGIVRLAGHPRSPDERLVVASLRLGSEATVWRFSALEVHGIRRPGPRRVELLAPRPPWRDDPEVSVRPGEIPPADRQEAGGFPVTTPLRTLRDVGAKRRPEGPRWVERAVRLGLASVEESREFLPR